MTSRHATTGTSPALPTVADVHAIPRDALPAFVAQLGALVAAAGSRLTFPGSATPTLGQPPDFLTSEEAADLCRCSTRTVRRRMADGTWREGTHWHRPAGTQRPRFVRSALVTWLTTNPLPATSPIGLAYTDGITPPRRRALHSLRN